MAEKKFSFYVLADAPGGAAGTEVGFHDWHTNKRQSVTFDANGDYSTNDEGIGEALEMLAVGHPLIRSGSRPKKGA